MQLHSKFAIIFGWLRLVFSLTLIIEPSFGEPIILHKITFQTDQRSADRVRKEIISLGSVSFFYCSFCLILGIIPIEHINILLFHVLYFLV